MTNGNGAPAEAGPPPQLNVLAQYTKDLSFENPNAPASLAPQAQQPAINIQINVSANNIAENEYEVTLSVEGKAETAGKMMFSFDLAYAGVFRIVNVPKENLHPLIMIECPRLLFPFAREIIATSVRDGGFPPLMLDPVDFVGLYRQNLERQATQIKPSSPRRNTSAVSRRQKIVPDRLVAQGGDKGLMGRAIGLGDPRRQRHLALPPCHLTRSAGARIAGLRRQDQLRLPRPDQVDIDLSQQLGIEQGAVLGTARIVDGVARTEIVKPVRDARMLAPRQQQRIDQPVPRNHGPFDAVELGIDEADVEGCVVDHQRGVADEFQEAVDDMGKQRLVGQKFTGKPMHGEGLGRHVALGIEVPVKGLPGRHAVENLDAADLDQPIAAQGIETGGFGIENDFAHGDY